MGFWVFFSVGVVASFLGGSNTVLCILVYASPSLTVSSLVSRYVFSFILFPCLVHLDHGKSILAVGLLTCILCFPVSFQRSSTRCLVLQDGIETYATYAQTPRWNIKSIFLLLTVFVFFRPAYILSCIVLRDQRCVYAMLCLDRVTCSFALATRMQWFLVP